MMRRAIEMSEQEETETMKKLREQEDMFKQHHDIERKKTEILTKE